MKKSSQWFFYWAYTIVLLLVSNSTYAITFLVTNTNDSGTGSLRQAVVDANESPGADNIVFSSSLVGKIITLTGGELIINETVKLIGTPEPPGRIRINGGANSRIFHYPDISGITLTLQDLVIYNGSTDVTGGAINIGGGNSTLILNRTLVSNNSVTGISANGGGIFCHGDVILNYSVISGNSVTGTDVAKGGGLHIMGNLTANYSTIAQNTASGDYAEGGGAFVQGDVTLNNSSLWGNTASGISALGGGISILGREFFNISGKITLNQSTISGNSVISGSLLSEGGGGLHLAGYGESILKQSTITNNSSNMGAGGLSLNNPTAISHSMTISNTILSGNAGPTGNIEDRSAVTGLINVNNSVFGDLATEIMGTNIANIMSDSPKLRPLNTYGGQTRTHLPYADSPVVDVGSNVDAASFIYDQRGGSRFPRIVNDIVDIGSVERALYSPAIFAIAPAGTIDTATPTFSWKIVPGFNNYAIRALDANSNVIFSSVTPIDLSCPLDVCSFIKQGLVFPDAPASWQIRIKEEGDTSLDNEWSSPLDFTVVANGNITIAIPLTPVGTIDTATPTFTWTAADGFDKYALRALDANGNVVFSGVTPDFLKCPMGMCSITVRPNISFPDGIARWQVRTEASDGTDGYWSELHEFTVATGGHSTLANPISPSGTIADESPIFTWSESPVFEKYALRLQDNLGNVIFSGVTPNRFSCENNICSYTISNLVLSDGEYTWRVRTEGDDRTDGFWSNPLEFMVKLQ